MTMIHKVEEQPGASVHRLVPAVTVETMTDEIKNEAERRILLISPTWWKQINALADNDTVVLDKIKAVRDASDDFESLLVDMTQDELDAVNVASWEGWPDD